MSTTFIVSRERFDSNSPARRELGTTSTTNNVVTLNQTVVELRVT